LVLFLEHYNKNLLNSRCPGWVNGYLFPSHVTNPIPQIHINGGSRKAMNRVGKIF